MRPSATLLSIFLILANIAFVYFWLFDTEQDLKQAEAQIRTQAFAQVKQKMATEKTLDHRLNPNLQQALKKPASPPKALASVAHARESLTEPVLEEVFAQHVEGLESGARLWCKKSAVEVLNFPARCIYRGNCFKCGEAELIKPDAEEAHPFCSNGELAKKFDTECCPSGLTEEGYKCPDMPSCLAAESVPAEGCTCGGSEECHYSPLAEKPDCVCAP
jgi:hypothetical protein